MISSLRRVPALEVKQCSIGSFTRFTVSHSLINVVQYLLPRSASSGFCGVPVGTLPNSSWDCAADCCWLVALNWIPFGDFFSVDENPTEGCLFPGEAYIQWLVSRGYIPGTLVRSVLNGHHYSRAFCGTLKALLWLLKTWVPSSTQHCLLICPHRYWSWRHSPVSFLLKNSTGGLLLECGYCVFLDDRRQTSESGRLMIYFIQLTSYFLLHVQF